MYNRYYFRHTGNTTKHPFKLPTKFTAPLPDNSNLQEYISNVYHDLKTEYNANIQPATPNISKQEVHSIHKLKTQKLAETKKLAYNLCKSNIIDNTTHKFLTSDSHARTPHLYLLPKIHKQDIQGPPVISGCRGPTVKLSAIC